MSHCQSHIHFHAKFYHFTVRQYTYDKLLSGNIKNTNVISSYKLAGCSEMKHASTIGTSTQASISSKVTKATKFATLFFVFLYTVKLLNFLAT